MQQKNMFLIQKRLKMSMLEQLSNIESFLKESFIFYKKDYHMKYHTYFKKGGNVKLFICPQNETKMIDILIFLNKLNMNYKILGFTSNILLFDEIEYSILISTTNLTNCIIRDTIEIESGYSLQDFCKITILNNSKGYSGLEGIPGSIGGAIFMNAGAYGYSISDNLISVKCYDPSINKIISLEKEECSFRYRDSIFKKKNLIILKAKFEIKKAYDKKHIEETESYHIARHSYQEFVYPNLGSMISINCDIYDNIFKKNRFYYSIYIILKLILKNPISKLIMRKKPTNEVFNILLARFIYSNHKDKIPNTVSKKSINILINDGSTDIKEIINHMNLIYSLVDRKFHIENELVVEPKFKIEKKLEIFLNEKGIK